MEFQAKFENICALTLHVYFSSVTMLLIELKNISIDSYTPEVEQKITMLQSTINLVRRDKTLSNSRDVTSYLRQLKTKVPDDWSIIFMSHEHDCVQEKYLEKDNG